MATEYVWASPGGAYTVPDAWRRRFLREFPDYRVRWSLQEGCWHLEQWYGRGALPSTHIDPHNDANIRAYDGYWLVMKIQPGTRMACPGIISKHPRQVCGNTITVPTRHLGEAVCANCRTHGRDGRVVACFWPFDETLLDELRRTNPLTRGIIKRDGKVQTRAAWEADRANTARERAAHNREADAMTSIDAVDYRWLSGIAASGATRRRVDDTTFR